MADLLSHLDKLDRKRAEIHYYVRKAKVMGLVMPKTAANILQGLHGRFDDLSQEREQTLELIWADPVLRTRMKDREKAAIEDARHRQLEKDINKVVPGRLFTASPQLKDLGRKVVELEQEESTRQRFLDEAHFYYGSGAWQNDRVDVGKLTKFMDELTLYRDVAREARGRVTDGLQFQLQSELGKRKESPTLLRESLLRNVRAEMPPGEPVAQSPLTRFLAQERPREQAALSQVRAMERSR